MTGAIASHVAQSTLFAGAAALLALAFRANQAKVRYWIWLSASLKFMIPFAVLTSLGSHIHIWTPSSASEIGAATHVYRYTAEYFSQPMPVQVAASSAEPVPAISPALSIDLPIFFVWGCGVICLASIRLRGWRRIRRIVRTNLAMDLPVPVEVRSSPGLPEPAVVGFIRPILLLPQGITERLTPSEMNAILAHELCHVRRHDNLLAFLHMIVETTFWFHPLVWWIGARLLEERERACDEDVVSRGARPDVYAEAILTVCKLYVGAPRLCACGVTGATLNRRIEAIMTNRVAEKLNWGRKVLLVAASAAVVAVPLGIGVIYGDLAEASPVPFTPQLQSSSFEVAAFEVASVKPSAEPAKDVMFCIGPCAFGERLSVTGSHLSIRYMSLFNLILTAWRIKPNQLSGPSWMQSQKFDIMATIPQRASKDQVPEMLQALLSERFGLAIHRIRKEQPVFALVVGRNGLKLQKAVPEADTSIPDAPGSEQVYTPNGEARRMENGDLVIASGTYGPMRGGRGANGAMQWEFQRLSMSGLASLLAPHVDRPVVDQTHLTDSYRLVFQNLHLSEGPGASRKTAGLPEEPSQAADAAQRDPFGEGLIRAIERAGLKLQLRKAPVEAIMVDHVEKSPTRN